MPNIGAYHPIIVHFAIALLILGVIFRWVSLIGRAPFTGPAAATLLILGAATAYLAVHSGLDAHGPVERIPGVRQAVMDHEDAGKWARNVFLVVALLEIAALFAKKRSVQIARVALWGSAVVGIFGVAAIVKTADRGGDLVYSYAGGVGIRSGSIRRRNRRGRSTTARVRRRSLRSWSGSSPTTRMSGCSRSNRSCATRTTAARRCRRCRGSQSVQMTAGCSSASVS
jgi:uncharacterized membrane protein